VNEENIFNIIRAAQSLSDKMVNEIFRIKNDNGKTPELNDFAYFITTLIDTVSKQGHALNILVLNYILIQKLSPRFGIHRFSIKEMDEQNEEYFEYFRKIDTVFKELSKIDVTSYSKKIFEIQNLFDEIPPISHIKEKNNIFKRQYKRRIYFNDYLTCILDFYESFLLLSLYILILLKLSSGKDVRKNLIDLKEGKKLKVDQIYTNRINNKTRKENLIYEYIVEYPLTNGQKKRLLKLFENIFGKEGIRELRNMKIHHYGEENMQIVSEQYLEVRYETGTERRYSLREIHAKMTHIQLLVYLGFSIINSAFFSILYQLLELEKTSEKE